MERTRILKEAKLLIEEPTLESCEKENSMFDIEFFISIISSDKSVNPFSDKTAKL